MDVEAWDARQGKLTHDEETMLRRIHAEHGPLDRDEVAVAVDLERIRLITEAVAHVVRDIAETTGETFEFQVRHAEEGIIGLLHLGNTDHQGFALWGDGADELLVAVADSAQDIVMHRLWTGWPLCPTHDVGLHAELRAGPVWVCRTHDHAVAPIGRLSPIQN